MLTVAKILDASIEAHRARNVCFKFVCIEYFAFKGNMIMHGKLLQPEWSQDTNWCFRQCCHNRERSARLSAAINSIESDCSGTRQSGHLVAGMPDSRTLYSMRFWPL